MWTPPNSPPNSPPDPAPAAAHWPQITSPPEFFMQRENTVFRVQTTLGPHALRLHRPGYHSPQTLTSELTLMAMLAGQGMHVPTPAPTSSGALLVALADQHASLLSWLPGTPMGRSGEPLALQGSARAALYHAIGVQMARLHALTDRWTPPPAFTRPRWDRDGLLGDTPTWGRFWDHSDTLHIRDLARATLDTAPPQDIGLIHADLVNENVLLDDAQVHFIDFDDSGTGYRLFDLATTLYKATDEPDFPRLQDALLSGYATHRPLPDLTLLPLFIVLRSLTYLGWIASRTDTPSLATRSDRYLTLANRMIDRYLT
jgi:Ser/Thr protein kinase RdoA (MazF antagonist)